MWMIADWLKEYEPAVKIEKGEPILRNVRILTPNSRQERQNVYVAPAKEYFGKGEGVICVHERDLLIFKTDDIDQIFNDILAAFDFYNDWTDGLKEKIDEGCTLQNILDESIDIFKNPIFILDTGYVAIAVSKGYGVEQIEPYWMHFLSGKSIQLDHVNKILPIISKNRKNTEIYLMDKSVFPFSSAVRNLFYYKRNKGTLSMIEVNGKSTKGTLHLFNQLANIIEYWIGHNEAQLELKDEISIFLNLLEEQAVIPAELEHKLDILGWKKDDDKILIKIKSMSEAEEIRKALITSLENTLFGCIIFQYESSLIIIVNLRIISEDILFRELRTYLTKTSAYAGVSYTFKDLFLLKQHYNQADIALRYGGKNAGKIYRCKDYALKYALNAINANIVIDICHPGLNRLAEYDKKHNTDFYETLKRFLFNERNQLMTAKEFNIHRNSLVYRIQKIEEIIGEDLDNVDTRLHLIFSFLIVYDNNVKNGEKL